MFVGRLKELEYLEDNYHKEGSNILVIYGHKGVGKTSLMFRFVRRKEVSYYCARPCSFEEQQNMWLQELNLRVDRDEDGLGRILNAQQNTTEQKKVLIIDEFQNIVKYSDQFMLWLIRFLKEQSKEYLVLLCSSSISFVENGFVPRIGGLALGISGFFKVPELGFVDCVTYFKNFTTRDCMEVYHILGGMPSYWARFSDKLSVEENIKRCILHPDSFLYEEGQRIVAEELRELNVYNTILFCLANGLNKLNDLHVHTGYSRAKISVYIKNLMERELVEKVFSFDNASSINAKKGVYRITNRYLHFYFQFMFQRQSQLIMLGSKRFYEDYIKEPIASFHQNGFKRICTEYLTILNEKEMLPIKASKTGEWVGKDGTIDIVMQNEEWDSLLCFCNWEKEILTIDDYNRYLGIIESARLHPDHIYIFSAGEFDENLKLKERFSDELNLIDINTL